MLLRSWMLKKSLSMQLQSKNWKFLLTLPTNLMVETLDT